MLSFEFEKTNRYIILLILSIGVATFYTNKTVAQEFSTDKRFTLIFHNTSIDSVILQIEQKCQVGFSYNPVNLSDLCSVSITFMQQPFKVILDSIFHPRLLNYTIIGKNIALARISKNISSSNTVNDNINPQKSLLQCFGNIIDTKSKKPVSFTNVYIKYTSTGTISNQDGNFIIKLDAEKSEDSLSFSCLGYKPITKKITDILNKPLIIELEPISTLIPEIIIDYIDPSKLLSLVLEKIKSNYSTAPSIYTGFYRETIRQNNDYVVLSEAVLKIYKAAYNKYLNDQVIIIKSRKSPFVKQMDTLTFKFQGGIYTSLLLDIAKNQSTFFSDEFLKFYTFKFDELTSINDRPAYVISFDQKDDVPYALYKGKIYIDKQSFAIIRADFEISPKGIDRAADELVRKSPWRIKVKPIMAKYMVNYICRKEVWYLSNLREEVIFKVHKRRTFTNTFYHSVAELVVTKTDSINVNRFRYNETVHSDDIFVEKIGKYDANFWGDYNYIKPELSIEEALNNISNRIKTLNR